MFYPPGQNIDQWNESKYNKKNCFEGSPLQMRQEIKYSQNFNVIMVKLIKETWTYCIIESYLRNTLVAELFTILLKKEKTWNKEKNIKSAI